MINCIDHETENTTYLDVVYVSQHIGFWYCKLEIFMKSVKSHICDDKNLRLGHDLPITVNDSDFATVLFLQNFMKINSKNFRIYSTYHIYEQRRL